MASLPDHPCDSCPESGNCDLETAFESIGPSIPETLKRVRDEHVATIAAAAAALATGKSVEDLFDVLVALFTAGYLARMIEGASPTSSAEQGAELGTEPSTGPDAAIWEDALRYISED